MPDHRPSIADLPHSSRRNPSSVPAVVVPIIGQPAKRCRHSLRISASIGFAILAALGCRPASAEPAALRSSAVQSPHAPFAAFVAEAAQRFGIPAAWIRAVMRAESFGDVGAISPKGAMGLMQIMPETWGVLRRRYGLGADPNDAHDNIIAGAAYLRELHDRYGMPGFLAAYNAGPARWEDHLATGRPLPAETRAYLIRLAPIVDGTADNDAVLLAAVVKSWTEASLFPARPSNRPTDKTMPPGIPSARSSIDRRAQDWTGLSPQSEGLFVALSNRGRPR